MAGNRKLFITVLYLLACTAVAVAVVMYKYDTLAGAALFAGGLATGVAAFMWGNAKEGQAKADTDIAKITGEAPKGDGK